MRRIPRFPLVAAIAGTVAAIAAGLLFPRAFPVVALEQRLTRDAARAAADSFFAAHELAPADARTAVRFRRDDSLRTFVELAAGGADSLNALVRGDDAAPYAWSVRAFVPGDPREARVDFAPDGRVVGFERTLADADQRPDIGADSAQRLAELSLATWLSPRPGQWTLVSSSFDTKPASGRVDRTFTFERSDRRIGGAPIRMDATIAGDLPAGARPYVDVPESFERRYAGMRAWNDLLAILATLGVLVIAIAGAFALTRFARSRNVRWRPALVVGGVIGALTLASALNELPGSWFDYDTAMSVATFRGLQFMAAIGVGLATALLTGFTLAAAEAATRRAFPRHLDWWKLWRFRGTRETAGAVGGGYAVAAIALAYVAIFYLVTRNLFGWWVPSELLDDPNQIASPLPWISAIAISLNAAVWEEALFRALPLSLLSLWVGQRSGRGWWMAGGVILTALVFGFAHANYDSWPPYSRGVEIFLDACFWGVLFLSFGLLVTVIAHFLYDAVLFGLFAAQGTAVEYRVTAAIVLAAVLAPAIVVLWRRARQGGWVPAPEEARFSAWQPGDSPAPAPVVATRSAEALGTRARRLAIAAAAAAVLLAVGRPRGETLGPDFVAQRGAVMRVADSMLTARGGNPDGWRRLTIIGSDTMPAWRRFLVRHEDVDAQRMASTFHPSRWWTVRYVHTEGAAAARIEEWRARVWPDGRPLDIRHLIADSAQRDTADAAGLRRIALASLARIGVDTTVLRESDVSETAQPARKDVMVTYTDTSVTLPAGAQARAWVQIAGDEPLVARRGIELPEEFLREDRARSTSRALVTGAASLLLITLVVVGALVVKRRPLAVDDGNVGTRGVLMLIGGLAVLGVLSQLNDLRSVLANYDTAQSWGAFTGKSAMAFVAPVVIALVLVGLWRALDGLRRRVGIPMLSAEPTDSDRGDMMIAGLGIGGAAYVASSVRVIAASVTGPDVPPPPATNLNAIMPSLSGVSDVPVDALTSIVMIGIPALVIAGITTRWIARAGILALLLVFLGGIVWSSSDTITPAAMVVGLATIVLVGAALVAWGARFAWSWAIAALTLPALAGLRDAVYGTVWQDRVAGGLAFLFAAGLIVLVRRRAMPGRQANATADDAAGMPGGALPPSHTPTRANA